MKDFFISYNRNDESWATWIAWELEKAGYATVVQGWDFRPGSNFVLEMDRASKEAERTIAVVSPDYLTSRWTSSEWAAAFARDPRSEKRSLVPVRVRECDVEGLLGPIVYIDLVGLDEATARDALLEWVKSGSRRRQIRADFPGHSVASRFPGAIPPVWNIPHHRNQSFTGREEPLSHLRKALTSGQYTAATQVISGLGGVGKTQLVLEYAYRHSADYDVVWWVRSEDLATLARDYAGLAKQLNLSEKDATEQTLVVQAVRDWLEHHGGWLLIFDDADTPTGLRQYLPRSATGHLLITSRDRNWDGVAQVLALDGMTREESVAFLLRRTGQADKASAADLAEALGDLPLALELTAAFILEHRQILSHHVRHLRDYELGLLKGDEVASGYESAVAAAWEISFKQVGEEFPAAADLLNLCAFLAPNDIPRDLLIQGAMSLPERLKSTVASPLEFDRAVAALLRYCLVREANGGLEVHRLVQVVTRNRLASDSRRRWASIAVRIVNNAFPFDSDDPVTWPVCARLLPHALAATQHAVALLAPSLEMDRLSNQVGLYLLGRAQYAEARMMFERSVETAQAIYGADHPTLANSISNLGSSLQAVGDLEGAKAHFERALAIGEKVYGPEHPSVAIRVNNLGAVLRDLGDLEGAKAHFERALAIDEKVYGPEHPTVATAVNNLGGILQDLGDLEEAKAHFERALAIDENVIGPDHPAVATDVNNLGSVLQDMGDLAGAKARFERALAIDEKVYSPEHPSVAIRVNNLGSVLWVLGDLEGAKAHFERALAIDEKVYGPEHPTVATAVNNLGGVLQALGDLEGAKAHFERALGICLQFFGEDHSETRFAKRNLVAVEGGQG